MEVSLETVFFLFCLQLEAVKTAEAYSEVLFHETQENIHFKNFIYFNTRLESSLVEGEIDVREYHVHAQKRQSFVNGGEAAVHIYCLREGRKVSTG